MQNDIEEQLFLILDEVLKTDSYLMLHEDRKEVLIVGDESWTWNLFFLDKKSSGMDLSLIFTEEKLTARGYKLNEYVYKTWITALMDIDTMLNDNTYSSFKKRIERNKLSNEIRMIRDEFYTTKK